MKIYNLGRRETGNPTVKYASIREKIVKGEKAYAFYSASDTCNYIYKGYSLLDAVLSYERDTRYQGFAEIEYLTDSEIIAKKFSKMPPF